MAFFHHSRPRPDTWSPASAAGAVPRFSGQPRRPSAALSALRSQLAASGAAEPADSGFPGGPAFVRPVPARIQGPLPEGTTIVVRNCSTKRVLQQLIGEFGGRAEGISGRYFVPVEQNLERIHDIASAHGFFVKETLVGNILVLDVMVDRARRFPYGGGPAAGGKFEDYGDEPEDRD